MGKKANRVNLIDFGISKMYQDPKTRQHFAYCDRKRFAGTALFASIRSHQGIEQSRRDDLEAVFYTLMYFYRGGLPW